eukprot:5341300-Prymnesium_polylepis.1
MFVLRCSSFQPCGTGGSSGRPIVRVRATAISSSSSLTGVLNSSKVVSSASRVWKTHLDAQGCRVHRYECVDTRICRRGRQRGAHPLSAEHAADLRPSSSSVGVVLDAAS